MAGTFKLKVKRAVRFCVRGGLRYVTMSGLLRAFGWHIKNGLKSNDSRKIIWLGPFSPIHANVGDHAQTLAVRRFLVDQFADCKVVRIYRDDISESRLKSIGTSLNPGDLVFIHSSGDFGSLHDSPGHHPGRLSFPEVRRRMVALAPANQIINLPVTAYYEESDAGKKSLAKDQDVFNSSHFTVLCREEESVKTVQKNLSCACRFFPDFVFYLKPRPVSVQRTGALVIIRNDKEARVSPDQRSQMVSALEASYSDVLVKDVMHAAHTIPDFILDEYMDGVFREFQRRELVVTDKMHGMITAVITGTPCIALNSGIPHKIKAYESFLSGAVLFVDEFSRIERAINTVRTRPYTPVDLRDRYNFFRSEMLKKD